MSKIVGIKKYLIQLNSTEQPWEVIDKQLLQTDKFKELKVGDEIEVIERSKNGIIKDFNKKTSTVVNLNKVFENAIIEQYKRELKLKCLEISFKAVFNSQNIDIAFMSNRQKAIQHAETLYNEILDKNYLNW